MLSSVRKLEKYFTTWNKHYNLDSFSLFFFYFYQVQFFLKKKSRESLDERSYIGARRLTVKRPTEMEKKSQTDFNGLYRAVGTLNKNKWVTHSLPSGDDIVIRMAYLGLQSFFFDGEEASNGLNLHKVSYNIGFTFGGPVAYNVEAQQQSVISKVRQIQTDSN